LAGRGFGGYALLTTKRALDSAPVLGDEAAVLLEVPDGPVPDAAAAVRESVGGRPLVALGGGRVIDSAKAVAAAESVSCAAVPTTLSGAEMTAFHRMPAGFDGFRLVRPAVVIADPHLMASQPMPALAASAMNALAHAIEALYTPMANPIAELAALRAAGLIADSLRPEEPERRSIALGALLAGYASGSAGFAIHHAVCQTIVRTERTPHAETNAVMLPHFVAFMEPRAPDAIAKLAAAIGEGGGGDSAGPMITKLSSRAGVSSLSKLGLEESALGEIVDASLQHPAIGNTPKPPDRKELLAVLEGAL
jgi:alcohol dehydrogenase class IV